MPERPPSSQALKDGYEARPMRLRPVLWFVFFFALSLFLAFFGVHYLEGRLMATAAAHQPAASFLIRPQVAPEPRLQPSPAHPTNEAQDFQALRSEEQQRLNSYGPVPGDPTHVHIPISRAMELMAQEKHS